MIKTNPRNERIKWKYLRFLEQAKRMKRESADQVAAALAAFEASTGCRDFALFRVEQAIKFKADLEKQIVVKTGKPLAVATRNARQLAVKAFYIWLAQQTGYRRLKFSDMEYFNPTGNEMRMAGARRDIPFPTLDEIRQVLEAMPICSTIERRDRALIAFTVVTGARDAAIASFRLKHIEIAERSLFQDGREVAVKFRKTFTSWFFPVGEDIIAIVTDWIAELRTDHGFGDNDPIFPKTTTRHDGNRRFVADGLSYEPWADAGPIRRVFKAAFALAGLRYFNPHSFRKTLWRLGEQMCRTPEELRLWSLNLGHEHVMTSFISYSPMSDSQRGEGMRRLAGRSLSDGIAVLDFEKLAAARRAIDEVLGQGIAKPLPDCCEQTKLL